LIDIDNGVIMFSLSMSPTADIVNWVTSADGCVHTSHRQHRGNTTRRDCRQLVANSVHSTHRRLASASCIGLNYFAVNNVKLQQKSYGLIGLITEPVFVHSWNDNNTANTCIANGNLYGVPILETGYLVWCRKIQGSIPWC